MTSRPTQTVAPPLLASDNATSSGMRRGRIINGFAAVVAVGSLILLALYPGSLAAFLLTTLAFLLLLFLCWYHGDRQRRAERRRQQGDALCHRLFSQSHDTVCLSTLEGRLIDINPAGVALYGYGCREEMLDLDLRDLYVDPRQHHDQLARLRETGEAEAVEVRQRSRDGKELLLEGTTSLVHDPEGLEQDPEGEIPYVLAVLRDVTAAERDAERRAHRTRHDALTDLPTRTAFDDHLAGALARAQRFDHRLAVLRLDLDDYPALRARLGPELGDELLMQVADRLAHPIRQVDLLARLGEAAFAVIKSNYDEPEHVAKLADLLLGTLRAPFVVGGQSVRVDAHVGIAVFSPGALAIEHLLEEADLALGRARRGDQGRICFFEQALDHEVAHRTALAAELEEALACDSLHLAYQPMIDLAERRIVGVEALLRWHPPQHGRISPTQILSVAQSSGQMELLSTWVLNAACAQARLWQRRHRSALIVALNLSARELHHPDFLSRLAHSLDHAGLAPSALQLDLTEDVFLPTPHRTARLLTDLDALGVRIALDDFGTGFSSIELLRRLPIHRLKIDLSFVHRIGHGAGDEAAIAAILAVARELGLQVVAEGVETADQLDHLLAVGCDEAQGYYFSRPLVPRALEDLFRLGNGKIQPLQGGAQAPTAGEA